ncbi:methyl-CpG-binding domain-containing protein 7 isoform X3 [Cannabis sativa]|uniref:methyl-CpG-binding domain-containing protein 7 isoform X3 n=1 Tax=Cannabis sativa TaxID=3483 RepID=UPI0029C9DFEB|nr:methyl-CpG-binding domain-containing protein 7 isoform X3 [Cannabis sativa]
MMKKKSRAVNVKPLRTLRPCTDAHSDRRRLLFANTHASSSFRLPHDWLVQRKPRPKNPNQIDKYYIEPGTKRVFRSLVAVERYLRYGETDASPGKVLKESVNKCMQIIPFESTSNFVLPDGWIIETKVRTSGATAGRIDRYYVEPGTGRQFRSSREVERHLKETNMVTAPVKIQHSPLITESPSNFVLPDGWIIQKTRHRKYYVDQNTGNVFRSLIAVERHLEEEKEKEYTMTLNAFKHSRCFKIRFPPNLIPIMYVHLMRHVLLKLMMTPLQNIVNKQLCQKKSHITIFPDFRGILICVKIVSWERNSKPQWMIFPAHHQR